MFALYDIINLLYFVYVALRYYFCCINSSVLYENSQLQIALSSNQFFVGFFVLIIFKHSF